DLLEDRGCRLDRRVARDLVDLPALPRRAHAPREDAVLVVALVREHALVAHPVLVDRLVVARPQAVDALVARVVVDPGVAARRAAGADARRRAQEPHARLEAEVAARQRADRADVLGHQRVVVVELAARAQADLVLVAALAHVEHVVLGDLVAEANAARAHDAALGVVDDGRAEAHTLGLVHRLGALALELLLRGEPVVLELALAGLV